MKTNLEGLDPKNGSEGLGLKSRMRLKAVNLCLNLQVQLKNQLIQQNSLGKVRSQGFKVYEIDQFRQRERERERERETERQRKKKRKKTYMLKNTCVWDTGT